MGLPDTKGELERLRQRSRQLGSAELRAEFLRSFNSMSATLLWLGVVLLELERRGESLDGNYSRTLLESLRRIGRGELLPEVFLRFQELPSVLRRLQGTTLEQQQQLLTDPERQRELLGGSRATPRKGGGVAVHSNKRELPSLNLVAKQATVPDLADMILELLRHHPHPERVWAEVLKRHG